MFGNKLTKVKYQLYRHGDELPYYKFEKKVLNVPRKGEKIVCNNYGDHKMRVVEVIHYPEPKGGGGTEPYVIAKLKRINETYRHKKGLETAEEMAEHFGDPVQYDLYKPDGWVERSMPITGHLIASFEDNRIKNVKLIY